MVDYARPSRTETQARACRQVGAKGIHRPRIISTPATLALPALPPLSHSHTRTHTYTHTHTHPHPPNVRALRVDRHVVGPLARLAPLAPRLQAVQVELHRDGGGKEEGETRERRGIALDPGGWHTHDRAYTYATRSRMRARNRPTAVTRQSPQPSPQPSSRALTLSTMARASAKGIISLARMRPDLEKERGGKRRGKQRREATRKQRGERVG